MLLFPDAIMPTTTLSASFHTPLVMLCAFPIDVVVYDFSSFPSPLSSIAGTISALCFLLHLVQLLLEISSPGFISPLHVLQGAETHVTAPDREILSDRLTTTLHVEVELVELVPHVVGALAYDDGFFAKVGAVAQGDNNFGEAAVTHQARLVVAIVLWKRSSHCQCLSHLDSAALKRADVARMNEP